MAGRISYLGGIITQGLVLDLDAAKRDSYVGTGTAWNDISGNRNNGTLINGPTFNPGNGGSIQFDGTNDYVDCGVSNIPLPTNITLSAWINQSVLNAYKNIITKEGLLGTDLDYGLTTSPNGNLYFWFNNGSFKIHETFTNNINTLNTWYHVTAVFSDTNNTVQLYANAIQIYNQTESTSLLAHANSKLFVGWRNSLFSGQSFQGNIAQTQIYNRALSATEVLQNYNATKTRYL
jgi:hypothetical protein